MKFYADFWTRGLDFEGRTNRKDFWLTFLVNAIIGFVLTFMMGLATSDGQNPALAISWIWTLVALIPGIAMGVRRMHDIGKSGANLLLGFIPLIGPIILLIFYCRPSTQGTQNK